MRLGSARSACRSSLLSTAAEQLLPQVALYERADAAYLGVAISAHGGYKKYKAGDKAVSWEGDRPFIAYENEIVTHHHLGVTGKKGGDQPILGYEKIPDVAWKALDEYNFGDADLPFGTKNFDKLIGDSMP